jgi:transposase
VSSLEATQRIIDEPAKRSTARTEEEAATVILTSLPSIGPLTATTLVVELGDLRRFRNSKAVTSYVGRAPRVANSADKIHHGRITKRGNRELRWIPTEWPARLLPCNATVKEWSTPLLLRMHRDKVRMALARRLLVGIYVMMIRGDVFSLKRCLAHA